MLNLPLVLDYGFVFLADEQPGFEFGLYQMSMDFNLPFRRRKFRYVPAGRARRMEYFHQNLVSVK